MRDMVPHFLQGYAHITDLSGTCSSCAPLAGVLSNLDSMFCCALLNGWMHVVVVINIIIIIITITTKRRTCSQTFGGFDGSRWLCTGYVDPWPRDVQGSLSFCHCEPISRE